MPFNMKHNAEVASGYSSFPLSVAQDAIDLLCEVEKVQTSPGHLKQFYLALHRLF